MLPALGEIEVEQATVDDLLARVPVRGSDRVEAAALKHDAAPGRGAAAGAARVTSAAPDEAVSVSDGSCRWRISEEALRRIVDDVRREGPPHAVGRERVRARMVALLQRQAEARRGDSPAEAWLRKMGRDPQVTGVPRPRLAGGHRRAAGLRAAHRPRGAGRGGRGRAHRRRAGRAASGPVHLGRSKAARWSAADAVLIDEAAGLIDRLPSFGHVVVDEAQDLSPMQCRAIARRSEHGSLTLLGDLAQGTAPWAARDWRETLTHLGKPERPGGAADHRLPGAGRGASRWPTGCCRRSASTVPAAVSLRRDGCAGRTGGRRARRGHGGRGPRGPGLRGLDRRDRRRRGGRPARARPSAARRHRARRGDDAERPTARVTVLPASLAKGLEYDHVIVVEPAEIVAAEPRGLNRLYVVLTRAVSRLAVLHTRPLPPELMTGLSPSRSRLPRQTRLSRGDRAINARPAAQSRAVPLGHSVEQSATDPHPAPPVRAPAALAPLAWPEPGPRVDRWPTGSSRQAGCLQRGNGLGDGRRGDLLDRGQPADR